jgi:hypothetical protein
MRDLAEIRSQLEKFPPRHREDGELCIQAVLYQGCNENHDYYGRPTTPNERRLVYVEIMLEELAALAPTSGHTEAGRILDVDDVVRDDTNQIITIMGTTHGSSAGFRPYIIAENQ